MEQVYNLILTLTFLPVATIIHYSFLLFRESKVVELHQHVGKHWKRLLPYSNQVLLTVTKDLQV